MSMQMPSSEIKYQKCTAKHIIGELRTRIQRDSSMISYRIPRGYVCRRLYRRSAKAHLPPGVEVQRESEDNHAADLCVMILLLLLLIIIIILIINIIICLHGVRASWQHCGRIPYGTHIAIYHATKQQLRILCHRCCHSCGPSSSWSGTRR